MSLKHAILGFLSFLPLSGYDLKKAFDKSVRHFWPANQSQIYRTLAELDTQGLVEKEIIPREERLDMKIYRLTEPGREELRRWLATPLPPQENREPFLIQVYFGGKLTDAEMLNLLERDRQAVAERLAIYSALYETARQQPNPVADRRSVFFALLTLEFGLRGQRVYLDWLDHAISRIQAKDYTPASLRELIGELE